MADREEELSRQLGAMKHALRYVAQRGDCEYYDSREKPNPCDCPRCVCVAALETEERWRTRGARYERTATMPRERDVMAAWDRYIYGASVGDADYKLAQILGEARDDGYPHPQPSVRDWYVASTVIQWMVTNVDSALLYETGYVMRERPSTHEPVSNVKP